MSAITKMHVPLALLVSSVLGATLAISHPTEAMTSTPGGQGDPTNRLQLFHPMSLLLPGSNAFAILGHDCGGIQEHAYVTGFDPSTGNPMGVVHLSTTCSAGGIGGHSVTYTAWAAVTWNFVGGVVSSTALSGTPTIDTGFTATDAYDDTIYNANGAAYLLVPLPAMPMGVTATQSGDDFLVAWTPTGVNPVAIVSSTLTATPINSSAPELVTTVAGSLTNGVITTLQAQTTYLITVVSKSISGAGPSSMPISVTTSPPTEPPGAPTGVTAHWVIPDPSGPTDTFIVTWNPADPGNSAIDQYMIRATDNDTGTSITQTVSGTTFTASFTEDWVPDWSITVQAHNAFGWGALSSSFLLGGL
jgi:hypothetical protein